MLVYSTKTDIINYHIKKIDINTPPWHTISYSECNNNIHLIDIPSLAWNHIDFLVAWSFFKK